MPKEGFVREDGMVYWRTSKRRGDIWLTPEVFQKYCQKRKEYRDMCRKEYYRRQSVLPENERNYFGRYNWKTNKYFIDITASGKEIWVYKKRFEEMSARRKEYRRKYLDRVNGLPKSNLKIGDQNPDNPNEYVTHFTGKIPRFGTLEQLQVANESRKCAYKKIHQRYRTMRREKMKWIGARHKRGFVDAVTGLIFWEYGSQGQPVWLPEDQFKVRHEKEKARRKKNRDLKRARDQAALSNS